MDFLVLKTPWTALDPPMHCNKHLEVTFLGSANANPSGIKRQKGRIGKASDVYSPDLSHVELHRRVCRSKIPTNRQELSEVLLDESDRISQQTIRRQI